MKCWIEKGMWKRGPVPRKNQGIILPHKIKNIREGEWPRRKENLREMGDGKKIS